MHCAIVGLTAAEIIHARADADKPQMGPTNWTGERPRKSDVGVAKNYLNAEELRALNLIVAAYLDFAELQAVSRRPMTMADWITKLDDFIRISDREILVHAGKVSHDAALQKPRWSWSNSARLRMRCRIRWMSISLQRSKRPSRSRVTRRGRVAARRGAMAHDVVRVGQLTHPYHQLTR